MFHWHNEYSVGTLMRPGVEAFTDPDEAVEKTAMTENSAAVIGTPDDLVARYVVPEVKGLLAAYRESRRYVVENRDSFQRANQAVLAKIKENERATAALELTRNGRFAIPAHQAPDMDQLARQRS